MNVQADPRFAGVVPFSSRIWLTSPTMHGGELKYVEEAIRTNWVSTAGANIREVEAAVERKTGRRYAVALSSGTAALHLAVRLCGEKLYGRPKAGHGALEGRRVFCSDLTFSATVNPVAYEGGEAVLIDTERDTWNMDPAALEKAFALYPEVRLIVVAHLYGTPGKLSQLQAVAGRHGALIVEDAAESFGAAYQGVQTGMFGMGSVISFNGNKIVTGSSGGMFLTDTEADAGRVRKWAAQSREDAPWYQHEELGYNYLMSNIVAGVLRGQLPYLEEHIARKKAIYERYRDGLRGLPVSMNPFDGENSAPNHWLSCMLLDRSAMCRQVRGEREPPYGSEPGKSCPAEILAALAAFNAEGRPLWKPMHMQPVYRTAPFVTAGGEHMAGGAADVGMDLFDRGLCLPSDIKMTPGEQDIIIQIIRSCFD